MMQNLFLIFGVVIGYLIGSIPTAFIFGKALKGIDIRKYGSGNVGATNALRVLGKGPGICVLLFDAVKGFITVLFFADLLVSKVAFVSSDMLRIILGFSCIAGHNWTIFLGFKGGKGMATSLGVLLGLAFKIAGLKLVLACTVLTWVVIFFFSKIVSLASVISAIALPLFMIVFKQSFVLIFAGLILSGLALFRHKSNLVRLLKKEEKPILKR